MKFLLQICGILFYVFLFYIIHKSVIILKLENEVSKGFHLLDARFKLKYEWFY